MPTAGGDAANAQRLRMLMVSPAAPWPATTGGLVRIAAILHQLARHFEVTFVAPRTPDQQVPDDQSARYICPVVPASGRGRKAMAVLHPSQPLHVAFYSRRELTACALRELADHRYDVVYSHFIYGMSYLRRTKVPVVIDQQNVDRLYWRNKASHSRFPINLLADWNARKTISFERRALRSVWAYVSVSEDDREQTRQYAQDLVKHLWVAPNGVDTLRFQPAPKPEAATRVVTLGFLGSMALQMNVEAVERFCRDLLPRIRQELLLPELQFLVVGSNPGARIMALAAATPGMSLSGTVDDVVPWLHKLDILVCPLRIGAGTKLKVAEALACGLPVVGSKLALSGMPGRTGEHYIRADSDEEFVTAVSELARHPEARRTMGRNARALAERHLDWQQIGERLAADISAALSNDPVSVR